MLLADLKEQNHELINKKMQLIENEEKVNIFAGIP